VTIKLKLILNISLVKLNAIP